MAERLSQALVQPALSMVDCLARGQAAFSDASIGIVSPTYDWGLPSIVKDFLEKADFQTEYLYFVATYGTTPGAIGALANRAIRGRSIDAYFSVRMADTWTPIFDLSTPEKIRKFTKKYRKRDRFPPPRRPPVPHQPAHALAHSGLFDPVDRPAHL